MSFDVDFNNAEVFAKGGEMIDEDLYECEFCHEVSSVPHPVCKWRLAWRKLIEFLREKWEESKWR